MRLLLALLAAAAIMPAVATAGIGAFAEPTIVNNAPGSSVPGCEETNECFIPHIVTVTAGSEVIWANSDSAVHTVTSGDGASDGIFDSSLLLPGFEFSHKFEEVGEYPYFCQAHPWMKGVVVVHEADATTDEPEIIEAPEPIGTDPGGGRHMRGGVPPPGFGCHRRRGRL